MTTMLTRALRTSSSGSRKGPIGLIASAGLLTVVAAIGLLVVLTGGGDHPERRPPTGGVTPPSGTTVELPQRAPGGIRWDLFQGVVLPYSETAGPAIVEGPVARGFARTPMGALLAGEHIGYRHFIAPAGGWRKVTELQVLPGTGRDRFIELRARAGDGAPEGGFGQIAGFRFVTYSPDAAVIQFVSRFPASGNLQVITSTLRWVDGDWRLELHPDGSETPSVQAIATLAAFIPWSGF